MARFEVWIEGYGAATGMEGIPAKAQKLGEEEAETFQQACEIVGEKARWKGVWEFYNRRAMTAWDCRLFDNEADARRTFG